MRKNSGNALIFILIAVFLLGGLSVVLMRTGGETEETGDSERMTIEASKILKNMSSIQDGITQLKLRGCSQNQISFENGVVTLPANSSAPADKRCHLFDAKGAGLTYPSRVAAGQMADYWVHGSTTDMWQGLYGGYIIPFAEFDFDGDGSGDPYIGVGYITEGLCRKLDALTNGGAQTVFSNTGIGYYDPLFYGVFTTSHTLVLPRKAGCSYRVQDQFYVFYKLLKIK